MSKASGKKRGRADCDEYVDAAQILRERGLSEQQIAKLAGEFAKDLRLASGRAPRKRAETFRNNSKEQWSPAPCTHCPPPDECEYCEEKGEVYWELDQDECLRGWLCPPCGEMIHDIEIHAAELRRALAYIDRPRSRTPVYLDRAD